VGRLRTIVEKLKAGMEGMEPREKVIEAIYTRFTPEGTEPREKVIEAIYT
jgi:hypothetical protein